MLSVVDDLGRTLRLKSAARRIVCLVPSITETLFALGAADQIVGVTDYCIHPRDGVRSKEKVGGTKNILVEEVLSLRPDLVIANAEENRKHQVERLEEAGIAVFVTFPKTVDGCLKMIRDVATLAGTEIAAAPHLEAIAAARAEVAKRASGRPPRVLCVIWKDPYMTISHDTYIDAVITEAHGVNIFADHPDRYPKFSIDEAACRQPDVILLPTEPYHFLDTEKAEFEAMGNQIPAVQNGRIHIVEGELLSWYGPRLSRALRELSALFF